MTMSKTGKMWFATFLMLSAIVRIIFFNYETLDYLNFLKQWVQFYKTNGGFLALEYSVGNYNIPYQYFLALFSYLNVNDLYLIKITSCLFDYLMAYSGMMIVRKCGATKKISIIAFFTILFLPTVIINSSLWAQCDSIYVGFGLLGIYLALDNKPVYSMICMAISFGFKLQAVFILPICVILLINNKYKFWHFLIFPATYLMLILPAVLLGRPFKDAFTLYIDQMNTVGSAANYNAPSLNALTNGQGSTVAAFIAMTIVIIISLIFRRYTNSKMIIVLSVIMVTIIPYLLPHMHDRYFYAADVMSAVVFFAFLSDSVLSAILSGAACVCQQFASLICYIAYLKTYYLRIGSIYLTNDRGAIAVLICLIIYLYLFSSESDYCIRLKMRERKHS